MSVYIFNDSGGSKTWVGQVVNNQAYFLIPETDRPVWSADDTVITDIGNADAIISTTNTSAGHLGIAVGVDVLKTGILPVIDVPKEVKKSKGYTASTELNSISVTTEHDYLLLKNPSASGKNILVTHLVWGVNTPSVRSCLMVYKNPTITTNGTSLTINNTDFSSSGSGDMEAYKDPTISARGTKMNTSVLPANSSSRGVNRFYLVQPGDSLLLSIQNDVSNASTLADVYWVEGV